MKTKLLNLLAAFTKKLNGYPRISETAPKCGVKLRIVKLNDPNFDRPLNEMSTQSETCKYEKFGYKKIIFNLNCHEPS